MMSAALPTITPSIEIAEMILMALVDFLAKRYLRAMYSAVFTAVKIGKKVEGLKVEGFEPKSLSAMDRNTEEFILNLIKKEQLKGLSVLMVTHKASVAKLADRIYVIENGVNQVQGTPKELAPTNNFFSQLIMDTAV